MSAPQSMPSAADAEKGVVGAIIQGGVAGSPTTSAQVLDDLRPLVSPDDFSSQYGAIYRKALELHRTGTPIDQVTLVSAMKGEWASTEEFWPNLIHQAYVDVPHAAHAVYHAGLVHDAANQRRLIFAMNLAVEDLMTGGHDTAGVVSKVVAEIDSQAEHRTNGRAMTSQQVILDVIAELEAELPPGIKTGFAGFDKPTDGLKSGQMITIAARPGVGKTSFMLATGEYVAEHYGPVLIVSQEMSRNELILRWLAAECGVCTKDLRGLIRNDRQRHRLTAAAERFARLPLLIDDQPGRRISDVQSIARIHKRQGGLSLICLDYLQLFKPENGKASTEEQISQISRDCKMLAKTIGVPVLVLAQLNRAIENRDNRRPRLADLRSSGAIEQDSDIVVFIDRPHMWRKEAKEDQAVLYLEKNRNGETRDIPLLWDGPTMRFSNPEPPTWDKAEDHDPMIDQQ